MSLLSVRDLGLSLPDRSVRSHRGAPRRLQILRGVSFDLDLGESLGIVGESGSGKTSLGRALLRLYEPTSGSLHFEAEDITHWSQARLRPLRERIQMVFQDSLSSLNPRHRVEDLIAQPLLAFGRASSRQAARAQAVHLLERVGLEARFARRYPHELSGGQRQRVGIARAIALKPRLVVADEVVSGLDVSTQAQILLLLRELKAQDSLIFISHDLSVVRVLCDRVLVMRAGEVVESGSCQQVFDRPAHPYTRELLESVPLPDYDPDWVGKTPAEALPG